MHDILRKQIILLLSVLLGIVFSANAQKQLYRLQREDQLYYFGITLGYNSSYLHQVKSTTFLASDSILSAEPGSSGGIAMGLLATARLTDHFQVRVNPQLIIGGAKTIRYSLGSSRVGEGTNQVQTLPSTLISFPLQIKFNSDRIGNFRTYLLGGIKYDIDLSSNASTRNAEDLVKLKRNDFGLEAGIGFNFYLPFVTVSPEIKISYGLSNIHQRDAALKYSSALDKIQSRMIVFSIHLED
ncbi:MAG: PorT family protein [Sediminibacterium sp.]|nr:PorT family protein [Sediminibacterium sp.]